MKKFYLVRKKFMLATNTLAIVEQVIEATDFTVDKGDLVFYVIEPTSDGGASIMHNTLAIPSGMWIECEETSDVPSEKKSLIEIH